MDTPSDVYEDHGTLLGYGAFGSVMKVRRVSDGKVSYLIK
jgi:hypothetical protein